MVLREDLFPVIAEDEELLAINKPAGLVCHPTKGDEYSSLVSRVRLYLGASGTPHLINRLDRETSGVVMVAKCDDAALLLRRHWESRKVEKVYHAIVHGGLGTGRRIDAPIGPDPASAISIKDAVRPDGAPAETLVFPLRVFQRAGETFSLLKVTILTGRKHQIRIHLQHIGHPIVGDKLYGLDETLYLDFVRDRLTDDQRRILRLENHALHAGELTFEWRGVMRKFACRPESAFLDFVGT